MIQSANLQELTPTKVGIFTPRQLKFIALYAMRDYNQTRIDIGKKVGVSKETLTRWFKNDNFCRKINEISLQRVQSDIPQTLDTIKSIAFDDRNLKACEIMLNLAGISTKDDKNLPQTVNNTQININLDQKDLETILHNTRHLRQARQKRANYEEKS